MTHNPLHFSDYACNQRLSRANLSNSVY
ncbi:hypothetical protein KM92DES2_20384 [uncultured Desulfovibrio sp.]|uniref:Uncharacterized protein n=1 Tax=uncultured Desulfovibrio sp. TaxID=167968 RepID=A0A212KKU4_9BACT|nr:hypothetical protein KM92DES2_20384 [uncultured Desulfovibrio sp.]